DKIVEYSEKLTDIFEDARKEDKRMKKKAYVSIAKNPKHYLETAREFYGEDLDHITETRKDEIKSVMKEVEGEK
ncbi:MAG: hypothetical protein ACOCTK_03015, partial [Candidatus Saliniplasma sp.]